MPIESIVRPYQSPDLSTSKIVIDSGFSQSNEPVHLEIGKGGEPKLFSATYSENETSYIIHKPKETQET
jgi:hypothetical protein